MIIDTLLHYFAGTRTATKDEIIEDLIPLGYATEEGLDSSRAMWVELVIQEAVWDNTDPEAPVLVSPRQVIPGVAVWISAGSVDDTLWDLPDGVARLQADREKHTAGDPDWLIRHRVEPSVMATVSVVPSFAGTDYPFGQISIQTV